MGIVRRRRICPRHDSRKVIKQEVYLTNYPSQGQVLAVSAPRLKFNFHRIAGRLFLQIKKIALGKIKNPRNHVGWKRLC